jgi:ferric-dicitrate binding protein FerR (iron transport regulator)
LPDGSKVWLNAASSLRFPTAFVGRERGVVLTGEAYFEIARDKNMPFKVQVNDMKVEVLGTHFNVMSYKNEGMVNTTLLEGAVRVSSLPPAGETGQGLVLKPGQQASIRQGASAFTLHDADIESVIAWKNGLFQFNNADIQTIMRQIERWYDVDIHYQSSIPDGHYSGTMGRDNSLLTLLRIFEESDLKFTIEGKKLTVLQ